MRKQIQMKVNIFKYIDIEKLNEEVDDVVCDIVSDIDYHFCDIISDIDYHFYDGIKENGDCLLTVTYEEWEETNHESH